MTEDEKIIVIELLDKAFWDGYLAGQRTKELQQQK